MFVLILKDLLLFWLLLFVYLGQPRFGVVEWNKKLLLTIWMPDGGKAANKMKYASCKEGLIKDLVGIHVKLLATEEDQLSAKIIKQKTK